MSDVPKPVTVVIPAHNEGARIGLLLHALTTGEQASDPMEILVVCNGCTDDTADIARGVADVRVIEIAEPGKRLAMDVGDAQARQPYRAYIDADVVISAAGVRKLLAALRGPVRVAAPARELDTQGASVAVRWYYDVWRRLPAVNAGVFGRGVLAMTPDGVDRVARLPKVMSDDLAISEAFTADERTIVPDAIVTIAVPRRVRDLLRRRIRVVTGNTQLDQLSLRAPQARTGAGDLLRIAVSTPLGPIKVAVFLLVTLAARGGARRSVRTGDFTTWLRDDSSRS